VEEQLESAEHPKLTGVLLTHGHSDAAGGLQDLNRWIARQPHRYKLPIITDATTRTRLMPRLGSVSCLQWVTVAPGERVTIGAVSFTPFPVLHSVTKGFPTMGFSFDRTFAYASDVSDVPSAAQKILEGVDTLVLDGAAYFGTHIPSHLTLDRSMEWAGRLGVRHLILTQIGHSYPPHEEAVREIRAYLKTKEIKTPRHVTLAFDGLSLTV
jgi:phosphoribosyl 1,2-cyclic phosphate phosphodiesterase